MRWDSTTCMSPSTMLVLGLLHGRSEASSPKLETASADALRSLLRHLDRLAQLTQQLLRAAHRAR